MIGPLQQRRETIEMNDRPLPITKSYVQGYLMQEWELPNPEPL